MMIRWCVSAEGDTVPYKPESIWATVDYVEAGVRSLSPPRATAYAFVTVNIMFTIRFGAALTIVGVAWQANYTIPSDFQSNASFGPLSGVSHEERVLAAYSTRKLQLKPGCVGGDVCTGCGTVGHLARSCPRVFA